MDRRSIFLLSFFLPVALLLPLGLNTMLEQGLRGPVFASLIPPSLAGDIPPPMLRRSAARPFTSTDSRVRRSWSRAEETRVLDLMARNATCPLLESRLTNHAPLGFLFRLLALSGSHRAGPIPGDVLEAYIRAVASSTEPEFHSALRSISHPLLRLAEASALLGLLGKHSAVEKAPEAAVPILRGLVQELPGNAVPSLLLAYSLHELGDPSYATELARALERPNFHTYGEEILQSVYGFSLEQPVLLPAALGIAEQVPLLDLMPVEDLVLESLVDADRAFAESALTFGRRLLRFEAGRAGRQEYLFWSALNYTIGQRVARGAWEKLHPELAFPLDLGIPRQQLLARGGSLWKISDRHFSRQERNDSNLALCEEAIPRYAQGLRREWKLAESDPALFVGQ